MDRNVGSPDGVGRDTGGVGDQNGPEGVIDQFVQGPDGVQGPEGVADVLELLVHLLANDAGDPVQLPLHGPVPLVQEPKLGYDTEGFGPEGP